MHFITGTARYLIAMSLAGFLAIIRPANTVAAGLAVVVAYLIATGTLVPAVLYLFIIVTLATAAGNVINDYYDAGIDAINRPDRPIPRGTVSRAAALYFSCILFLGSILVSLLTNPLCIAIVAFNCLLLIAYAAWLKRTPFFGNAAVSYLAASMFLFGGALSGIAGVIHVLPVAGITFFAMFCRELVKAAEDVEGDRASGASTLPVRIGIRKTIYLALSFAIVAIILSYIPYFWWGAPYAAGITLVNITIILAGGRIVSCTTPVCIRKSSASHLLKAGMFASLIIFTLSAVFL